MTEVHEFELRQAPSDGIAAIRFAPSSPRLLVASWDATCRLYDTRENALRIAFQCRAPQLACAFADEATGLGGGLDKLLRRFDFNTGQAYALGNHDDTIKAVVFANGPRLAATGSWDRTVRLWDPRQQNPVSVHGQPDKVYTMAVTGDNLVVGTAGRHVWIWDVRQMGSVKQRRESSLKFQTRYIAGMPSGEGYAVGSIEGRVAVEYIDPSAESQKRKFAFKCHRQKADNGEDTIYPVNALAFHPSHGTFASGGCDGIVNIWDAVGRKRLYQFHKYPTSISALDFNHDGTTLAIASSYTMEEGDKDHPPDTIFVRHVTDAETKAKA